MHHQTKPATCVRQPFFYAIVIQTVVCFADLHDHYNTVIGWSMYVWRNITTIWLTTAIEFQFSYIAYRRWKKRLLYMLWHLQFHLNSVTWKFIMTSVYPMMTMTVTTTTTRCTIDDVDGMMNNKMCHTLSSPVPPNPDESKWFFHVPQDCIRGSSIVAVPVVLQHKQQPLWERLGFDERRAAAAAAARRFSSKEAAARER